ncbi:MAG: short-chain dehydrogenase [Moraxellaceae bacterium]|nr:MAG: short-chain dehydrogenase [Moraxellaceae bacterium]
MSPTNKWALVTGASAGIGKEIATVFAHNRYNIVLVARRREKLESVAEELSAIGVKTHIIVEDLSDPSAPERIFTNTQENHIPISCLVNNAGFGFHEQFHTAPWEHRASELNVMIHALTHLCYLYLPSMKEQQFGRIINLSSTAAFLPPSPGNLYSAIKSYVALFSQSLHMEVSEHNIHVCALCPGFTYSEFHDSMNTRDAISKSMPKIAWMEADEVAQQGYDAVMKGTSVYINGNVNRTLKTVLKYTPEVIKPYISKLNLFGELH